MVILTAFIGSKSSHVFVLHFLITANCLHKVKVWFSFSHRKCHTHFLHAWYKRAIQHFEEPWSMKHSIKVQCTALQLLCNTTLINMALQIIAGVFQLAGATTVAVSYI